MEKKLKSLFEYQRFENEPRLAKLIAEAEAAGKKENALDDEDLELLFAAGEAEKAETEKR